MITPQRVLVLAPHTDDAELGCGGTLARWTDEGADVFVAVFSTAEESLPPGARPGQLRDECHHALDELKVPVGNRFFHDHPVREFGYHRQEILEQLISLRAEVRPEVVLVPAGADLHQDHGVIHQESLRAFRHLTMLGYEMPWNHITFSAEGFVVLDREHLERKWRALTRYASQIELARPYFSHDTIEAMARVRGLQMKAELAEAYEVIRLRL
ncbi:PIG-L deacetylase family protein [Actinomycetospora sp. CA-101289]|uniref:PIG-L deacetylase family protein n=1 Tax=Actinomycetospora sp. CA-101289 TaxID=3239893 RepID=UPI003D95F608